jgi:glycosyltransferase involved in cell wall biosynthesis
MRIALLAHHVAPIRPPFVGGVESLTWYLARWLGRRGHDVTLYALPGSDVPGVRLRPLDRSRGDVSQRARLDVDMPPEAFLATHAAYLEALLELAAQPHRFDVIHSHSLHYLPVAMAPQIATPMLTTLHTPPTPWLESALRARIDERAPTLSAVSPTTRALWRGIARVDHVVANGIDFADWRLGAGGSSCVWSGRIVPEKAPHLAIDAARAAGLPIRLAGPVIDRAYHDAEVAPRLGDDAVHVGHLDHGELARLLGASRVAIMTPAWEEPFGLVALEAMATGTPVAAFSRGGLVELVGPQTGRLAPPRDVDALARAIAEAARLPRAQVRAAAAARFGIDAMGIEYERLYERLAARRPRSGFAARFGLRRRGARRPQRLPAPASMPASLQAPVPAAAPASPPLQAPVPTAAPVSASVSAPEGGA